MYRSISLISNQKNCGTDWTEIIITDNAYMICQMLSAWKTYIYRKTSNISRTLVGNKIVDNSDVVGASPVGAAPTTSSFST